MSTLKTSFVLFTLLLLTACSPGAASPTATPTTEPSSTPAPQATAAPPTANPSALRFRPILLTVDDFPDEVAQSDPQVVDNVKQFILAQVSFSDSFAYGFDKPGSDYLTGITGFLDDEAMVSDFDANVDEYVNAILANFYANLAGSGAVPLTEEDQPYLTEITAEQMPEDVHWASNFLRANDTLVRLDVVAFRRGNAGVYLIYISSPAREPVIDITAVTAILEERIRLNQPGE